MKRMMTLVAIAIFLMFESLPYSLVYAQRQDGLPKAWTQYEDYASPNEDGYAYYIFDDPDVSSEIMPLTEESSSNVLLFTFDDAPNVPDSKVLEMAQTMKEKDVNAIFLVNGRLLESEEGKNLLKQIHEMGFEIGNHTTTHPNLREMTYDEQLWEIQTTNDMIKDIIDAPVRWFRPPFGKFNLDTIKICNDLGLQLMTWSFGYDWMEEYHDGNKLAEVSLDNDFIRAGGNILMHDLPWTNDALEEMIDGYRKQGFHIVDPYLIKRLDNSEDPLEGPPADAREE